MVKRIKISEREKALIKIAGGLEIVSTLNPIVEPIGRGREGHIYTALPLIFSISNTIGLIEFKNETRPWNLKKVKSEHVKKIREVIEDYKIYLSELGDSEIIMNHRDERSYTGDIWRYGMVEREGSWEHTTGLYTWEGVKIPLVLRKGFRVGNLENRTSKMKLSLNDYNFSPRRVHSFEGNNPPKRLDYETLQGMGFYNEGRFVIKDI